MIRKIQCLLALIVLCTSTQLMSQQIEGDLTPGGFALVPVFSLERPSMRFGLKPIAILDEQAESGVWIGLVGIDLLTSPGNYLLTKKNPERDQDDDLFDIAVQPIEHGLRPSRTITTRIEEYFRNALTEDTEDYTALDLIGDWQETRYFSFPFLMPLERGKMDDDAVGAYVRYPSGALEPVNALFIRSSSTKAPVIAPSGGKVHRIELPEGRLTTTSIVIDHGQGMFSILKGEIISEVEVGEIVEVGSIIATFGEDGGRQADVVREVAWQLILNGDLIDPSHFLNLNLGAYFQKLTTDAEAHFSAIRIAEQARLRELEAETMKNNPPEQENDSTDPAVANPAGE